MNRINNAINTFKNSCPSLPTVSPAHRRTVAWATNGAVALAGSFAIYQLQEAYRADPFNTALKSERMNLCHYYCLWVMSMLALKLAIKSGIFCYDSFAKWTQFNTNNSSQATSNNFDQPDVSDDEDFVDCDNSKGRNKPTFSEDENDDFSSQNDSSSLIDTSDEEETIVVFDPVDLEINNNDNDSYSDEDWNVIYNFTNDRETNDSDIEDPISNNHGTDQLNDSADLPENTSNYEEPIVVPDNETDDNKGSENTNLNNGRQHIEETTRHIENHKKSLKRKCDSKENSDQKDNDVSTKTFEEPISTQKVTEDDKEVELHPLFDTPWDIVKTENIQDFESNNAGMGLEDPENEGMGVEDPSLQQDSGMGLEDLNTAEHNIESSSNETYSNMGNSVKNNKNLLNKIFYEKYNRADVHDINIYKIDIDVSRSITPINSYNLTIINNDRIENNQNIILNNNQRRIKKIKVRTENYLYNTINTSIKNVTQDSLNETKILIYENKEENAEIEPYLLSDISNNISKTENIESNDPASEDEGMGVEILENNEGMGVEDLHLNDEGMEEPDTSYNADNSDNHSYFINSRLNNPYYNAYSSGSNPSGKTLSDILKQALQNNILIQETDNTYKPKSSLIASLMRVSENDNGMGEEDIDEILFTPRSNAKPLPQPLQNDDIKDEELENPEQQAFNSGDQAQHLINAPNIIKELSNLVNEFEIEETLNDSDTEELINPVLVANVQDEISEQLTTRKAQQEKLVKDIIKLCTDKTVEFINKYKSIKPENFSINALKQRIMQDGKFLIKSIKDLLVIFKLDDEEPTALEKKIERSIHLHSLRKEITKLLEKKPSLITETTYHDIIHSQYRFAHSLWTDENMTVLIEKAPSSLLTLPIIENAVDKLRKDILEGIESQNDSSNSLEVPITNIKNLNPIAAAEGKGMGEEIPENNEDMGVEDLHLNDEGMGEPDASYNADNSDNHSYFINSRLNNLELDEIPDPEIIDVSKYLDKVHSKTTSDPDQNNMEKVIQAKIINYDDDIEDDSMGEEDVDQIPFTPSRKTDRTSIHSKSLKREKIKGTRSPQNSGKKRRVSKSDQPPLKSHFGKSSTILNNNNPLSPIQEPSIIIVQQPEPQVFGVPSTIINPVVENQIPATLQPTDNLLQNSAQAENVNQTTDNSLVESLDRSLTASESAFFAEMSIQINNV